MRVSNTCTIAFGERKHERSTQIMLAGTVGVHNGIMQTWRCSATGFAPMHITDSPTQRALFLEKAQIRNSHNLFLSKHMVITHEKCITFVCKVDFMVKVYNKV